MDSLETLNKRLARAFRALAGLALVAMMTLTCVDVVLRALGHPLVGAVEVEAYLGTMTLAFALPQTQARRGHVGVMVVVEQLPARAAAWLEALTTLGALALCAVIAWQSWLYGASLAASGEVSMTLELPVHMVVRAVATGFSALCLVLGVQFLAALATAARPGEAAS